MDSSGFTFKYTSSKWSLALCSKKFDKTQQNPRGTGFKSQKHFDILEWTGNDANHDITGLQFKPDFVWVKGRNLSANLYNVVTGANVMMYSNRENEETDNGSYLDVIEGGINVLPNGFRVNNNVNEINGSTYVAWCWKAGGASVTNDDGTIQTTISANQESGFRL